VTWRSATWRWSWRCLRRTAPRLDACRALIDVLETTVPIWKHQRFADGAGEWVGSA
jgi:molybdopterin synthase catalytic subunit